MLSKLLTICLISVLTPSSSVVYQAAESLVLENHFSAVNPQNSDPLDDLLVIDEFKNNYLFGSYLSNPALDDFDVIATLEYGYSPLETYNLYLYVFNQSGVENDYNFAFSGNRIEIFNESNGSYEHAPIKYVSISSDKKFIKYRLDVLNQDYTRDDGARQYGIVGIEIASIKNELNNTWALHDYEVGHSWVYTGMNDELQVDYASDFEYLELDVNVGCYQTGSSSYSPTAKNNLFYSYFAVPQTFAGEEYSLYSVHADYYDFDLSKKFAAVIDEHDYEFYYDLWNQYAADDGNLDADERTAVKYYYDEENGDKNFIARYFFYPYYDNDDYKYFGYEVNHPTEPVQKIINSFSQDPYSVDPQPAPYFINIDSVDETVPFSRVEQYLDIDKAEQFSGQLREDVYRDIHYTSDKNPINDATYVDWDLLSYGDTHNDWDNFWSRLSGVDVDEASLKNVPCIEKVNADVLTNLDSENESQYLVESEDLRALKNYYTAEQILLKDTYIFRFNANIYESRDLYWYYFAPFGRNHAGYIVTKYNVAIDFDVIDLTFINDYEELLQIPVVSDPHNVGSDLTPPPTGYDFSWLFMLIGMILVIILIIWIIDKLSGLFSFTASANNSRQIHSLKKEIRRSNSSNIKKRYKRKR